jgi:hypothetical protein
LEGEVLPEKPWIILDMFGDIGVLIAVVLYIGIQTGS